MARLALLIAVGFSCAGANGMQWMGPPLSGFGNVGTTLLDDHEAMGKGNEVEWRGYRYQIIARGKLVVLFDRQSGETWLLKTDGRRKSHPRWVPIRKAPIQPRRSAIDEPARQDEIPEDWNPFEKP